MRWLVLGTAGAAAFAVLLKLFTFEFYFADDPTSGLALRTRPGWENKRRIAGDTEIAGRTLISDENDFIGGPTYRALVGWGYAPLVLLAVGLWAWQRRAEKSDAASR